MSLRLSSATAIAWLVALAVPAAVPAQQTMALRPVDRDDFSADAGVRGCNVVQLEFGADGRLWAATTNGLLCYDGYRWRRFGVESGLPSRFARALCLARDGRMWVGTDAGAGWFDGERFHAADTAGNLAGPSVRRIVEDPDGSLWFCCDQWPTGGVTSGLSVRRADGWHSYTVRDGLPSDYVSDFAVTSSGRRFALTARGLAELRGDHFVRPLEDAGLTDTDVYIWSLVEDGDDLVVSGKGMLCRCRDGVWQRHDAAVPGNHDPSAVKLWRLADGAIVAYASGHEDRVQRLAGTAFEPWSDLLAGSDAVVEDLVEAADGSLWACGVGFITRWQPLNPEWSIVHGLGAPQLVDRDGRVWFGDPRQSTFHADGEFTAIADLTADLAAPLALTRNGVLGRRGSALAIWNDGTLAPVALSSLGLTAVTHWLAGPDGWPWVAGRDDRGNAAVVHRDELGWHPLPPLPTGFAIERMSHSGDDRIAMILRQGDEHMALIADTRSSKLLHLPPLPLTIASPRLLCDGESVWLLGMQKLRRLRGDGSWEPIGTLPGDTITGAFRNGTGLWVACEGTTGGSAGLARLDDGGWHLLDVPGRSVVGADADGTRYLSGDHAQLTIIPFRQEPRVLRLPIAERAQRAVRGADGDLWIGTARGVLRWRPDAMPPRTAVAAAPTGLGEDDVIQLRVDGQRWQRPRHKNGNLQVSWSLDGGPWQPFALLRNQGLSIGPLSAGPHRIGVRVRDEAGEVDPQPAEIALTVRPTPLQQRWWFWAAVALSLGALGLLGGIALRSASLHRATKARLRAEERYGLSVQNSPLGILELDGDGRIVSINAAGLAMLGFADAKAAHGQPWDGTAVANERTTVTEAIADAVRGQSAQVEYTTAADRRILAFLQPLRGASDAITSVTVNLQDITQQHQLETRLRHGQRMESIGQLAGGIAHDFNNLLTAVLGNIEILRDCLAGQPIDPAAPGLLDEVEAAGRRAAELTRQLLTFARDDHAGAHVLDAVASLRGVEPLLRRILHGGVKVHIESPTTPVGVRLEPGQFEQIVINLAANAADAMPNGGALSMRLASETLTTPRTTRFGVIPAGDHMVLRVQDQGSGIAPDQLPRVFEPFFTTKAVGSGTGLGLATVHGIVRRAGGGIDVTSRLGVGTGFEIWLPRASGFIAPRGDAAAPIAPDGSETVLVCDDQPLVRRVVTRTLREHGYVVIEAEHAEGALAAASAHDGRIDLLVTDLIMPVIGGRQLAAQLVAQQPGLAVLFMTGYDAAKGGSDGVLAKPFTTQQLLERVRVALDPRPKVG